MRVAPPTLLHFIFATCAAPRFRRLQVSEIERRAGGQHAKTSSFSFLPGDLAPGEEDEQAPTPRSEPPASPPGALLPPRPPRQPEEPGELPAAPTLSMPRGADLAAGPGGRWLRRIPRPAPSEA
jgi:hypothetical protein